MEDDGQLEVDEELKADDDVDEEELVISELEVVLGTSDEANFSLEVSLDEVSLSEVSLDEVSLEVV